uniref:Uncharacterized protein n=1 Tax=Trichogramma kaykai TaxID=54128 RepID=A0ABD2XP47_9HYME
MQLRWSSFATISSYEFPSTRSMRDVYTHIYYIIRRRMNLCVSMRLHERTYIYYRRGVMMHCTARRVLY